MDEKIRVEEEKPKKLLPRILQALKYRNEENEPDKESTNKELPKLTIKERLGVINDNKSYPNLEKCYNSELEDPFDEENKGNSAPILQEVQEIQTEILEEKPETRRSFNLRGILGMALSKTELSQKSSLLKSRIGERLNINRQTELLQSFVGQNQETQRPQEDVDEKLKEKLRKLVRMKTVEFSQLDLSEVKKIEAAKPEKSEEGSVKGKRLKSGDLRQKTAQIGHKQLTMELKKRKKRRRRLKPEEVYTDKDRAAAITLGSRDIKHSLKMKKRKDRFSDFSIPEEAEPGMFLALANHEIRKNPRVALDFINKALELNPLDKNALVARSKCYIILGQPQEGLKDAETALSIDKHFAKAIYQKAESLYHLSDFEHSLMYFHRGLKLRPENDSFQLGVKKAQRAIENAIGSSFPSGSKNRNSSRSARSSVSGKTPCDNRSDTTNNFSIKNSDSSRTKTTSKNLTFSCGTNVEKSRSCQSRSSQTRNKSRSKSANAANVLRELKVDQDYLAQLLSNPDIKCRYKEDDTRLMEYIQEAMDFLNKRQEFWRQQLPMQFKRY